VLSGTEMKGIRFCGLAATGKPGRGSGIGREGVWQDRGVEAEFMVVWGTGLLNGRNGTRRTWTRS